MGMLAMIGAVTMAMKGMSHIFGSLVGLVSPEAYRSHPFKVKRVWCSWDEPGTPWNGASPSRPEEGASVRGIAPRASPQLKDMVASEPMAHGGRASAPVLPECVWTLTADWIGL